MCLKKRICFILLFLVFFYSVNNFIWMKLDHFPPYGDEAGHLLDSLEFLNILKNPSLDMINRIIRVNEGEILSFLYPPFFPFFAAILNFFFGYSIMLSKMSNIFFVAILLFSIYFIGKKMNNPNPGLLAAFIVSMYPFVFGLSRMFMLDFALTAMVCFSFFCLLYTERFTNRLYSILFGISMGLGMLVKFTFIFFIIGPFAIEILSISKGNGLIYNRNRTIFNLIIVFILGSLIAGIWYSSRLPLFWYFNVTYLRQLKIPELMAPKIFSIQSLSYYFNALFNAQITPFFFLLFLVGLPFFFKKNAKLKYHLLSWVIIPCIIFTLIRVKSWKHTVPYLPAIALITASGILNIRNSKVRKFAIYSAIAAGLMQYYIISFTKPEKGIQIRCLGKQHQAKIFRIQGYTYPITEVFYNYPRQGDWKIDEIMRCISENNLRQKEAIIGTTDAYMQFKTEWFDPNDMIGIPPDNFVVVNCDAINYFCKLKNLSYRTQSLSMAKSDWRMKPEFDFIISVKRLEEITPVASTFYKLILQVTLPDKSKAYVYKKALD